MLDFLKVFKREGPKGIGYVKDYITGKPVKASKDEMRRQFVERRLVNDFRYPKELLGVDVDVGVGGKRLGSVDIAIFKTSDIKDVVNNVFAFVLVKSGDLEKLKKFMLSSSAEYGLLYSRENFVVLKKLPDNTFEEVCVFPTYGEDLKRLGGLSKSSLRPTSELGTQIDDLYRYVADAEGLSGSRLLDEFLKLLMLKLGDEVVGGDESLAWISDEEFSELIRGVESSSFKSRVDLLINSVKGKLLVEPEAKLGVRSRTVAEFFRRLHNTSLLRCNDVSKYESLRTVAREHLSVGRGEMLTPHPLADLMVRMLNPSDEDLIVDPACGSGRLVSWSIKHVRSRYDLGLEDLSNFVKNNMLCVDVNPDAVKLAKAYIALYAGSPGSTLVADSLTSFDVLRDVGQRALIPEHLIPSPGRFDVVLTHPPFNIKGKVSNPHILDQYELGYKWNYDRKSSRWVKTSDIVKEQLVEVLFIERCFQMLKMYGRMAIVLSEEILALGALAYVRQWLVENARILATVSLPPQTFIPYGVKAKAFLLIIQKVPKEELEKLRASEYNVYVANLERLGYDAFGIPIYKRGSGGEVVTDELGNPVLDNDVQLIVDKFDEFKRNEGIGF